MERRIRRSIDVLNEKVGLPTTDLDQSQMGIGSGRDQAGHGAGFRDCRTHASD